MDPGDVVRSRDGTQQVSLATRTDARVMHVVEEVLIAFRGMGAKDDELDAERRRLLTEADYFAEWCQDMPQWHPGAFYTPLP